MVQGRKLCHHLEQSFRKVPEYGFTAPIVFNFLISFIRSFFVSTNLVVQVDCLDRVLNAHIVQKFLLAAC